jgi:CRISPR-associated protein Cas6
MLWEEKTDPSGFVVSDEVVDLSFRIECNELPIDHAWPLYQAIQNKLPWIDNHSDIAIHSIHGAASGNGWSRPPENSNSKLQLSRRTRLYLRIPKNCIEDARMLSGSGLELLDCTMQVGECRTRLLIPTPNIYCRSLCLTNDADESEFTRQIIQKLDNQGINVNKLLCGLSHHIHTPHQTLSARSFLIADLSPDQSIYLQQQGIGSWNKLGCGIFLPHKSLTAVGEAQT